MGSIVQALFAVNGDGWNEKAAAAAQASQVSIISVCSSLGRFLIGMLRLTSLSRLCLTLNLVPRRLLSRLTKPDSLYSTRDLLYPLFGIGNLGTGDADPSG